MYARCVGFFSKCADFTMGHSLKFPRTAHLVANELGAFPEAVRNLVLHPPLKPFPVLRRDAVPILGSPIVQVVDAVQVHIL